MRATSDEMKATAAEFTRRAAELLAADGWRLLRAAPPKENVVGYRYDKLIHATTLEIVDIIVNGDDPSGPLRRVSWEPKGRGDRDDVGPETRPTEPGNGDTGNGGGDDDDSVPPWFLALARDVGAIAEALESLANTQRAQLAVLDEIKQKGVTLKWR